MPSLITRPPNAPRIHPQDRLFLDEAIVAMSWHPHDPSLAAISGSGELLLVKHGSLIKPKKIEAHRFGGLAIAWSPDGSLIASVGQDSCLKVWEASTLTLVHQFELGKQWVELVAWQTNDCLAVAMGKLLFVIYIWDGSILSHQPFEHTISGLAWQDEEHLLVTTYGQAALIALSSWQTVQCFAYPEAMLKLCLSPNRKHAAIGCQDGKARVWSLVDDEALQMSGADEKVQVLAWSDNSQKLAISGGPLIAVWDFQGAGPRNKLPTELDAHPDIVCFCSFAPQSLDLMSGDLQGNLAFWSLADGNKPKAYGINKSPFVSGAWDATGQLFASGDLDATLAIWQKPLH